MELHNLFAAGGVVMWPLLACSVLAVTLILERLMFWLRVNRRQRRVVREVLQLYRQANLAAALA
ncbi:MAG TPA: hypothetical protein V6D03_02195, partial [Candidatus Caenarcaniphilales bacterium]